MHIRIKVYPFENRFARFYAAKLLILNNEFVFGIKQQNSSDSKNVTNACACTLHSVHAQFVQQQQQETHTAKIKSRTNSKQKNVMEKWRSNEHKL